jgi:stage II sporulation protein M
VKSLKKERYDGFFGGLYKRNETFLILSAVILFGSIFVGYAFAGLLNPILGGVYGDFQNKIVHGQIQLNTFSLFFNNLSVALIIYIGGAILGIIGAAYLIFNGLFIGYAGTQFPLGDYIIYTIPHGIPELLGIIISGAAGFRLGSCVLNIFKDLTHMRKDISKTTQFKYIIGLHVDEFWESLKLLAIAVVLLMIAAFIEANITLAWGSYVKSAL